MLRRIQERGRDRRVGKILLGIETRKEVETLFDEAGISDPVRRTRILRKAMGDPITHHSIPLSVESVYQVELSMYCAGAWRRMR